MNYRIVKNSDDIMVGDSIDKKEIVFAKGLILEESDILLEDKKLDNSALSNLSTNLSTSLSTSLSNSHAIDINNNILKNNNVIVYPNEKIYQVAPIIESEIEKRDNYQPSSCLIRCQNCIRMLLDFATQIYIYLEYFVQWFSAILVVIDLFNITKKRIKIDGRSKKYNYFTIEWAETERFRRILYWYYYNKTIPDEDQWSETLKKFNLEKVPKYTMRLYINNEKSKYSIEVDEIKLKAYINNIVVKGERIIKLYEDIISEPLDENIFISVGKKLLKSVDGKIPVGGLMPDRFIKDLDVYKFDKVEKKDD